MTEPNTGKELIRIEHLARKYAKDFPEMGERYVPGDGEANLPQAFVVGTSPDAISVMHSRPFAGGTGVMLRQLMRLAGMEPTQSWFTLLVPFKLPSLKAPSYAATRVFRELLQDEWRVVNRPKLILAIGVVPFMALTGKSPAPPGTAVMYKGGVRIWHMSDPVSGLNGTSAQRDAIEHQWERLGTWLSEQSTDI